MVNFMTKTALRKERIAERKIYRKLNSFRFSAAYNSSICDNCLNPHPFNQLTECDFLYLELAAIGMAVMVLGGHINGGRISNPFLVRRTRVAWERAKARAWRDHSDKIVHIEEVCHTSSRHILNDWILIGDDLIKELSR
jgi:hypothetical protein